MRSIGAYSPVRPLEQQLRTLMGLCWISLAYRSFYGREASRAAFVADEVFCWKHTGQDMKAIHRIVRETVKDPVKPKYLRPELRQ
jgi:hypothetical protein